MKKISAADAEQAYRSALAKGLISAADTAVFFYSLELLKDRLDLLKSSFPNTLHAVAIKANAEPGVLKYIAEQGHGLEAASMEEVLLAVQAGVPNEKIVFDSPVKTQGEIAYCHENLPGLLVNANSLKELERYPPDFSGKLGLRINPLVDSDAPGIFNVSTKASKFGVPITQRSEIISAYRKYPHLTALHLHVGSGIKDFSANVQAVKVMVELAAGINSDGRQVDTIDIGGGIDFASEEDVREFATQLKNTGLFNYNVITEYGKFIHKDAGFVVSDIEYILPQEDGTFTALIHVGADLFLRKVYSNLPINYPYSVIRSGGNPDTFEKTYHIAGPLCFAGDFLYHNIALPALEEGDKFVMLETGANTLSMWSRHCNRKVPKLILY